VDSPQEVQHSIRTPFRPAIGCGIFIAGGDPMPAPAKAMEAPIEALPLEERIQRRAYELYVERGNQSGSELDDWLQAEQEVKQASVRGFKPRTLN
jgi:hypothetical protein